MEYILTRGLINVEKTEKAAKVLGLMVDVLEDMSETIPRAKKKGYFINCGSDHDAEEGPIKYVPDDEYILVGNKTTLNKPDILPILQTLRFFPNAKAKKYCYTIPVNQGGKYLVKTIYYYGGFDGREEPPVFDQIIDGTKWSIVNTTDDYAVGGSSYYEAIVMAQNKFLSVCVARNEHTAIGSSPFISSLEVHNLDDSVYNSTNFDKNALVTVARSNFGSTEDIVSFPDDNFNRYWQPFIDDNPYVSSHSTIDPSRFWNSPPQKAFTAALTTSRGKTLTLNWPPFLLSNGRYYIALYFQDNRTPSPFSWRVFDIYVNGEIFYQNLNVTASGQNVFGNEWPLNGQTVISLIPENGIPVGPLINAGELFQILPLGGKTVTEDVITMNELRREFKNLPEDWAGDPCLPRENSWTGVSCSEQDPIRVISLNLTGSHLSGSLPESISKLTALKYLLLGDNNISGTIPDLRPLKSLEILHLDNNELEGSVPNSLAELPYLRKLTLENNKFNGSIPEPLKMKNGGNILISSANHVPEQE